MFKAIASRRAAGIAAAAVVILLVGLASTQATAAGAETKKANYDLPPAGPRPRSASSSLTRP